MLKQAWGPSAGSMWDPRMCTPDALPAAAAAAGQGPRSRSAALASRSQRGRASHSSPSLCLSVAPDQKFYDGEVKVEKF